MNTQRMWSKWITLTATLSVSISFILPTTVSAVVYQPGQTLDPSCLPTDPNCYVTPPITYSNATSTVTAAAPSFTATSSSPSTLPYASTTAVSVSGGTATTSALTLGNLTGLLRAVSGVVQTTLVNLASDVTGVLAVINGGTGTSTAPSYGQLLMGNGTGGYALVSTSSLGIIGGSSLPGGSPGQLQFNNGGSFGGSASLSFATTTGTLSINGSASTTNLVATNATTTNFSATVETIATSVINTLTASIANITNATIATLTGSSGTFGTLTATSSATLASTTVTGGLTSNTITSSGTLAVTGTSTLATTTATGLALSQNGLSLASSTPVSTTNALYNLGGTLFWAGNALGLANVNNAASPGQMLTWDGTKWSPAANLSFATSTGLLSISGTASSTNLLVANNATTSNLVATGTSTLATTTVSNIAAVTASVTGNFTAASSSVTGTSTTQNLATTFAHITTGILDTFTSTLANIANATIASLTGNTATFGTLTATSSATLATTTASNLTVSGTSNLATTTATALTLSQSGLTLSSSTPFATGSTLYNLGATLYWNGAPVSLFQSLNGLSSSTQLLATGSTGSDFGIISSGNTHTFNLPTASATARGLISTTTQTFAGAKSFTATTTMAVVDMNNTRLMNLPTPTATNDAANKAYVDSFVSGISWQNPVNAIATTTAPGSPATGDRYILGSGASGFGSCTLSQIAQWSGSAWTCSSPIGGWTAYVTNLATSYNYNASSTAWVSLGSTVNHNTLVGLQGGNGSTEEYHLNLADYNAVHTGSPQLLALQTTGAPSFQGLMITGSSTLAQSLLITGTTTANGAVTVNGQTSLANASSSAFTVTGTSWVNGTSTLAGLSYTNGWGNGLTLQQNGLALASSTPVSTTNALYNLGGTLFWAGNALGLANVNNGTTLGDIAFWDGAHWTRAGALSYATSTTLFNVNGTASSTNLFASNATTTNLAASALAVSGASNFLGNVGIGTTTMPSALTIQTSTTGDGIRLYGTGNTSPFFKIGANTTYSANSRNYGIATDRGAWGNFQIYQSNAAAGDPYSAGSAVLTIDVNGNLTTGTTTAPSMTLSRSGLTLASSTPVATANTLYNLGTTLYWNGNAVGGVSTSTTFSTLYNATAANSLDNTTYAQTWNWSTATTTNALTLSANALTTGSLLSLTSNSSSLNSTNGLLYVANTGSVTNGIIGRIQSNSTAGSGLTILANGNIGIGNSTPAYALDVTGFVNTDQNSGYKMGGSTVLYQNSTTASLAVGAPNAALWMASSSALYDVAIGASAMSGSTTVSGLAYNTAVGVAALNANTDGVSNTGIGGLALSSNMLGIRNTAVGTNAFGNIASTSNSVAFGYRAGLGVSGAAIEEVTSIGTRSGYSLTTGGNYNTFLGYQAGYDVTSGSNNILLGEATTTGTGITTGSNNILIGNGVTSGLSQTGSNQLNIGNLIFGTGLSSGSSLSSGKVGIGTSTPYTALHVVGQELLSGSANRLMLAKNDGSDPATSTVWMLDNDVPSGLFRIFTEPTYTSTGSVRFALNTSSGYMNVTLGSAVSSTGVCYGSGSAGLSLLGTCSSDARLKTNVQNLVATSGLSAIMQLRPVSFDWRDATSSLQGPQTGFIAQELDPVLPGVIGVGGTTTITLADGTTQTITDTRSINYNALWAPTILAIQQLATQNASTTLALTGTTTPGLAFVSTTTAEQTFESSWFAGILRSFFASVTNGIDTVIARVFKAQEVDTQQLCVTDASGAKTCITKSQLDKIISGQAATQNTSGSGATATTSAATFVLNGNNPVTWQIGTPWQDGNGALFTYNGSGNTIYSTSTVDTTKVGTTTIDYWVTYFTNPSDTSTAQLLHITRNVVVVGATLADTTPSTTVASTTDSDSVSTTTHAASANTSTTTNATGTSN